MTTVATAIRTVSRRHKADDALLVRLCDLFSGNRTGNLGPDLYRNGGAEKFENILSGAQAYTPFSGEIKLLNDNAEKIGQWIGNIETAIIVGPGPGRSVQQKELTILSHMQNLQRVITIELSPVFNQQSADVLRANLSGVAVHSFEMDFRDTDLSHIADSQPALVISTGSLTNYEDCQPHSFPQGQVTKHISKLAELAGSQGKILWGYNSSLNAEQYNRPQIDDFLMYPLVKASRMGDVRLDASGFRHETKANTSASTLTHYWIATCDQDVEINGTCFAINEGEHFPMFFSVAQSPERLERLIKSFPKISSFFYEKDGSGAVIHGFDCK